MIITENVTINDVQYKYTKSSLGYYRMMKDNNKYVQDQIHLTNVGAYNLAQFYYNKLKHLPLFYTTY